MRIVARVGDVLPDYAVLVGDDPDPDAYSRVRVLNTRLAVLFPEQSAGSLFNHCPYYERYEPGPEVLEQALGDVTTVIDTEGDWDRWVQERSRAARP